MIRLARTLLLTLFWVAITPAAGAFVHEDPTKKREQPWSNTVEFSFVLTSGNSRTFNFAFTDRFTYQWSRAELTFDASALRTETDARRAANVGGSLIVTRESDTTAEGYAMAGKFRLEVHDELFWYASSGWERNRFSGIDNRFTEGLGMGYRFLKDEKQVLLAELGLAYADETRISGTAPPDANFTQARGFGSFARKITETSAAATEFEVLFSFNETDDIRMKSYSSFTTNLTEIVALKVSFTVRYDGDPVVQILTDPAMRDAGEVTFVFDEVDTILSTSLVIDF